MSDWPTCPRWVGTACFGRAPLRGVGEFRFGFTDGASGAKKPLRFLSFSTAKPAAILQEILRYGFVCYYTNIRIY